MQNEAGTKCTQTLRFTVAVADRLKQAAKEDRRTISEQAALYIEQGLAERQREREKR